MAAVAHRPKPAFDAAATDFEVSPLSVSCGPGRDVDHAVDGVRAPQRGARSANDLDALDVFEKHVLDVPENAGEQRRIDTSSVREHEQLIGGGAAEAAGADFPDARGDLPDVKAGDPAQCLWNCRRAGAA